MAKKTPRAKLISEIDVLWYQYLLKECCEVCGRQASQVHHFYPKGQYAFLRHDLDNGISLCPGCHFTHHSKGDPRVHDAIIESRGERWYNNLKEKSRQRPKTITIGELRNTLQTLKDLTIF